MIKILKSLMLIIGTAAMATGTTHAMFTDTTALSGDFKIGNLTLSPIDGSNTTITFYNLKPGDTIRKWITLQNTGSLPIGSIALSTNQLDDPHGLLNTIKVSVIGWDNNPSGNAYFTPNWNTGGQPITFYNHPQDVFSPTGAQYVQGTLPATLAPGATDQFVLDFTIPSTDTTQYQSATFNLDFTAAQTAGTQYSS